MDFTTDWMLFWTAVGAIGGALGSIATAAAVIVALWQVRYTERKTLKLRFSDAMVMESLKVKLPRIHFIRLCVINNGKRNVVIDHWGYDYHGKQGQALLGFNQSALAQGMNPALPFELAVENKMDLYLERRYFITQLQKAISEGVLQKSKKITFFVVDSTGKVYPTKSRKTVGEMLKG